MDNIENLVLSLSKEATPVKPAPQPLLLSLKWIALALAYLIVALAVSGPRPDLLLQLQHPLFVAELTVLFGLLVTAALSTAVLAFPDLHQQRAQAFFPLWMIMLLVLVLAIAWLTNTPTSAAVQTHSIQCTLALLLFSLLPSVTIFYAVRRLACTRPQQAGSVALLFAFSTGALWLRLYEANDSIIHIIGWHYLPMIVVGVFGWIIGKSVLKW